MRLMVKLNVLAIIQVKRMRYKPTFLKLKKKHMINTEYDIRFDRMMETDT